MSIFKPNEDRAKGAYLTVLMATGVRILISYYNFQLYLACDYSNTLEPLITSQEDYSAAYDMIKILDIFETIMIIVSAVLFIRWFRRAYYNLESCNSNLNGSNEETVYSWMIPVWNLIRPFQLMRELYHETKKILLDSGRETMAGKLKDNILNLWWFLWILQIINGLYVYVNNTFFMEFPPFIVADIFIISPIINIVLGLVTFRLIWDYFSIQSTLTLSVEESSGDNFVQRHLVE